MSTATKFLIAMAAGVWAIGWLWASHTLVLLEIASAVQGALIAVAVMRDIARHAETRR